MKLRSPEAFWLLKNGILNSYPSLSGNTDCDIAVIGAGITGSLISHSLHKAGYNTIVIDKRDVGAGSSAATTSMLQYEIDTPLNVLAKMVGEEKAISCYRAGIESLKTLEKLIKSEKIDCGFALKNSLQVSHSEENIPYLKNEFHYRLKHGFNVQWLTSNEIKKRYKMNSFPGILSEEGASIDAFQFAHNLFKNNSKRGLRIYDHTPIKEIKYGNDVKIIAENGYTIRCRRVIFCTGFETHSMFKKKYADIVTTFASVSEEDMNLYDELKDVLIWDTDNPYVYMRTTDDKRLLIGGGDVPFKYNRVADKLKNKKSVELLKKTEELFPSLNFKEDYFWSGAFGVTKDGLPYIGEHPNFPNAIFVLGFGGNGITFSVQGMELVLKILAKQHDELLATYRFNR